MSWSGHYHGYGPWAGSRDELGNEYARRPGAFPGDEQTLAFTASPLPPLMTSHALLRRSQTTPGRTWTTTREAVDWLRGNYAERPPSFEPSGLYATAEDMLLSKVRDAENHLPRGSDTVWEYYGRNGALVSYSVVCCPSLINPHIPCPLPPG